MALLSPEQKAINSERRRKERYNNTHKLINEIDHKFCNKHYEYFPDEDPWFPATLEYFYKNKKNSIDGLSTRCKECEKKIAYQQWILYPERQRESHRKYEKSPKFKIYSKRNRINMKEYNKQWRKDNPEKNKKYIENHRNHDISTKEWNSVQKYFNNKCAYCGKTLEQQYEQNNHQFHREHVDHDGYNDVRNCVPACSQCNSTKCKRNIQELFESKNIHKFTQDKYNKIMLWCNEDYKKYIEEKLPYKITRKQNEDKRTYYFQLWTVDEKRNMLECIATGDKKKDIMNDIKNGKIIL